MGVATAPPLSQDGSVSPHPTPLQLSPLPVLPWFGLMWLVWGGSYTPPPVFSAVQLAAAGIKHRDADHAASHLGRAVGITTLLRGMPVHAAARRSYLPVDLCAEARVSQVCAAGRMRGGRSRAVHDGRWKHIAGLQWTGSGWRGWAGKWRSPSPVLRGSELWALYGRAPGR